MSSQVPVLMYHSISDRATASFRRWTVSPDSFAAQMGFLAGEGYTSLTASEYARCLGGRSSLPAKPVVITFDDGYADFADAALPVMRSFDLSSTLFVTSGYVDGRSEWLVRERETRRPMLRWDRLAAIAGEDVEYGGHGFSHRQFDTMAVAEAMDDIVRGRRMIEDRTGRSVTSFAYPHGYSTQPLRNALASAGFTSAHAVVDAMSSLDDRLYAISRIIVHADVTLTRFASMVAGSGTTAHPSGDTWRQTAWRWWRRARIAVGRDAPHLPS